MTRLEIDHQQEYQTRVLVFKVDDRSEMVCKDHNVRYNLRMFKGTAEEFEKYYLFHVGNLPTKNYLVYDNPEQVDKVLHGHKDGNIIQVKSDIQKEKELNKEQKRYLKSGY